MWHTQRNEETDKVERVKIDLAFFSDDRSHDWHISGNIVVVIFWDLCANQKPRSLNINCE